MGSYSPLHPHGVSRIAMATAAVLSPHDVDTTFNYYTPIGDEAPFQYVFDPPEGRPQNNLGNDPQTATVHDVRGRESEFNLDNAGFQFIKHVSSEKEFLDHDKIVDEYYKEVEELLKKELGAKRLFIFDHTIRFVYVAFYNRDVTYMLIYS